MATDARTMAADRAAGGECDIRVWSGDCRQSSYTTDGEKYLCASCGMIPGLDHEVRHDIFPYISGDTDKLY